MSDTPDIPETSTQVSISVSDVDEFGDIIVKMTSITAITDFRVRSRFTFRHIQGASDNCFDTEFSICPSFSTFPVSVQACGCIWRRRIRVEN